MVHRTLIGPALAAAAALLAFGGITAAQAPLGQAGAAAPPVFVGPGFIIPAVAPAPDEICVPEGASDEATGPDTDNIQQGDQTGPDEATGPDTDNIQQGDQTGPDDACAADSATSATTLASITSAVKVPHVKVSHVRAVARANATSARAAEQGGESESSGESSGESDGPGGHEDTGANADHQFEGEE